ncbi:hypothetical protein TRAPUB_116 [Trametes pubescens]|uniref:DUF6534 domain-containing protein n=1 Tax=Trametes pubescens TaxID=154538 RepID=A0A1M2VN67_TRAPU|nr:hypothetical protein TRAPUB_116 [Trametes pubescens]
MHSTMIPEVFFQAFTGLFVQSFYAVRVWKLSGRRLYLVIPVVAFIAAEFCTYLQMTSLNSFNLLDVAYISCGYGIRYPGTFLDLGKIKVLSISINGFAAAGDVVIAAILCTILQVSKTGFSKSNLLVNRLIVFSVNTGLLTSVCACMSLITILALPDTFVYICFFFLIGRLYSNSLMATLNARKSLREKSTVHDTSLSLRDINPSGGGATANLSPFSPTTKRDITSGGIAIRIDTTQDTRHDIDEESAKYGSQDKHEGIEAV